MSNTITLPHLQVLNERNLDINTLPEEIQQSATDLNPEIDEYENNPDAGDKELKAITQKSKKIAQAITTWADEEEKKAEQERQAQEKQAADEAAAAELQKKVDALLKACPHFRLIEEKSLKKVDLPHGIVQFMNGFNLALSKYKKSPTDAQYNSVIAKSERITKMISEHLEKQNAMDNSTPNPTPDPEVNPNPAPGNEPDEGKIVNPDPTPANDPNAGPAPAPSTKPDPTPDPDPEPDKDEGVVDWLLS